VALTDNYAAAALDSSSAMAADNFSAAVIRNSAEAVIDSCAAALNNCVPGGADIAVRAGWVLVVGVVLDASVATGWVPDGTNAEEDRCDDSARGTALPPRPAS